MQMDEAALQRAVLSGKAGDGQNLQLNHLGMVSENILDHKIT